MVCNFSNIYWQFSFSPMNYLFVYFVSFSIELSFLLICRHSLYIKKKNPLPIKYGHSSPSLLLKQQAWVCKSSIIDTGLFFIIQRNLYKHFYTYVANPLIGQPLPLPVPVTDSPNNRGFLFY